MNENSKGFTLIEGLIAMALIAIAVALISGMMNASSIAHAKRCETSAISLQSWERQWEQSKASGNPDLHLCAEMNKLINDYNGRCGEDFGPLPAISCG